MQISTELAVLTHINILPLISSYLTIHDFVRISQSCHFFKNTFQRQYLKRLEQLLLDLDAVKKMSVENIGKCIDIIKANNPIKAFILLNSIMDDEFKSCLNPFHRRPTAVIAVPDETKLAYENTSNKTKEIDDRSRAVQLEEMLGNKFGIAGFFGVRSMVMPDEGAIVHYATLQATLRNNPQDRSLELLNQYFHWVEAKTFSEYPERCFIVKNNILYSRFINQPIETLIAEWLMTQIKYQKDKTLRDLLALLLNDLKKETLETGCYTIEYSSIFSEDTDPVLGFIQRWLYSTSNRNHKMVSFEEAKLTLFKNFVCEFFAHLKSECDRLRSENRLFPKTDLFIFKDGDIFMSDFPIQKIISGYIEDLYGDKAEGSSERKAQFTSRLNELVKSQLTTLAHHKDSKCDSILKHAP